MEVTEIKTYLRRTGPRKLAPEQIRGKDNSDAIEADFEAVDTPVSPSVEKPVYKKFLPKEKKTYKRPVSKKS